MALITSPLTCVLSSRGPVIPAPLFVATLSLCHCVSRPFRPLGNSCTAPQPRTPSHHGLTQRRSIPAGNRPPQHTAARRSQRPAAQSACAACCAAAFSGEPGLLCCCVFLHTGVAAADPPFRPARLTPGPHPRWMTETFPTTKSIMQLKRTSLRSHSPWSLASVLRQGAC
jgi:hypothetical protein